jgi:hypothetical protein
MVFDKIAFGGRTFHRLTISRITFDRMAF